MVRTKENKKLCPRGTPMAWFYEMRRVSRKSAPLLFLYLRKLHSIDFDIITHSHPHYQPINSPPICNSQPSPSLPPSPLPLLAAPNTVQNHLRVAHMETISMEIILGSRCVDSHILHDFSDVWDGILIVWHSATSITAVWTNAPGGRRTIVARGPRTTTVSIGSLAKSIQRWVV